MNFSLFAQIMAFYIVLSYLLGPIVFYYAFGKTWKAAGNGYIVGSVASILLWQFYGSRM